MKNLIMSDIFRIRKNASFRSMILVVVGLLGFGILIMDRALESKSILDYYKFFISSMAIWLLALPLNLVDMIVLEDFREGTIKNKLSFFKRSQIYRGGFILSNILNIFFLVFSLVTMLIFGLWYGHDLEGLRELALIIAASFPIWIFAVSLVTSIYIRFMNPIKGSLFYGGLLLFLPTILIVVSNVLDKDWLMKLVNLFPFQRVNIITAGFKPNYILENTVLYLGLSLVLGLLNVRYCKFFED